MNNDKISNENLINTAGANSWRQVKGFGKRHILVLLGLLGFANVYALRVNLSVALVVMVNSTYSNGNEETKSHECSSAESSSSRTNKDGTFKWDQDTQGIILGSFFYGYIFTQLPGGWIATKYGAKRVFCFGVLWTSVLTLLTPVAARFSLYALIALRILEGLGEGVTFPAMHSMWSYWAPPLERSKLVPTTYAGSQIGTIIAFPLSGWLCANGFDGGWPSVFYIFGTFGSVWFLIWMYFAHDTPRVHPTISPEELEYIETTVGEEQDHVTPKDQGYKTPWKSIMTSLPVWAIIVAHFTNNWGFYTLLTTMPTYFKEVLGVNIRENGLISAIPYICNFFAIVIAGQISDYARCKRLYSTEVVRKIANSTGFILAASSLIGASFVRCHQTALAVFLLSLSLIGSGISQSGHAINHLDIGARYAGVLLAITNTVATIPGIVSPYLVGYLTNNKPTRHQWQTVFYIAAFVYAFGLFFFLFFGSGTEQKWNRPEHEHPGWKINENESCENPSCKLLVDGTENHQKCSH
ncbi:LOW QUALITY PROTEIN: sialin-like [Dendronephthya gigantea]|uniref:LOW QUALITY PROTEIN: sialin-like n=1 Tax=Dendronephthya gigantea TaxID=151771 RepID=UPI00106A382B|nr:LOW QUALITY PROTEIN: sialin-like [Dendronephthya gigantea]